MRITQWDQVFSEKDTHETVSKLVTWHLSQIKNDSARGSLNDILSAGHLSVIGFDLEYAGLSVSDARHIRQILAFFQKRKDLELGIDKRGVALRKFRESEALCLDTNRIFRLWASGKFQFFPDTESVLFRAQRIIASILGDVPSVESLDLGFGPGATTQIKRKISSARSKLGEVFCCSKDLIPKLSELLAEMPAWVPFGDSDRAVVDVEIHPCRLSFVPKNAKTDRGICTEPSLNVIFQRGIGAYMTQRLSRFGVDLLDQSCNKILAMWGSRTGALATLDLSSASDLISKEVVYHLLPYEWAEFLAYGRSSECSVDGKLVTLEKFSSMGNGFTFPLESLIFFALARAVCPDVNDVVSIYGDDIILPTERSAELIRVLEAVGFSVNTEKSYVSGPFRESCGGDFLLGSDIRPYYLKDRFSGASLFQIHNFYVRSGFAEPAKIVLDYLADPVRIYGPDGYGDGHLLGDYRLRAVKREQGWSGGSFDTYTLRPLKDYHVYKGDHVLPCYTIYANPPVNELFSARFLDPWGERPVAFTSYRSQSAFYRRGVLGVPIPGYKGYKRISIYMMGQAA